MLCPEKGFNIYNYAGKLVQNIKKEEGNFLCLDISDNANFIATASDKQEVSIWYFNSVKNKFAEYNSFTCHDDTIWSCDIASNNQYVLTASADSSFHISSFNGRLIHDGTDQAPITIDKRSGLCNAKFYENNNGIQLKYYQYENGKIKFSYRGRMFYGPRFHDLNVWRGHFSYNDFQYICFDPKVECTAYTDSITNKTEFLNKGGGYFSLYSFEGQEPEFSKCSNLLLTRDKNTVYLYVTNYMSLTKYYIDNQYEL
ncbi:MAG: hypothetical protein C0594_09310 [Marinilabiliales bacterium]|nr:MAG: hypothetical protein C0594_09310 [Marinilabiliales bacterium]